MAAEHSHVVALVVQDKLTKLELLDAVSRASGRPIVAAGTPGAHVDLGDGDRADVEVPKFGEDVQLAVDVTSRGPERASTLLEQLRTLGLTVSVLGETN